MAPITVVETELFLFSSFLNKILILAKFDHVTYRVFDVSIGSVHTDNRN